MPDIIASIVLFNHNPEETITSFLNTPLDVHVIIVDNSPVKTVFTQSIDPRVTYVFNNRNLGFAAAQNIALEISKTMESRYHLILNPDISFAPGTIEELTTFMDSHRNIGMVLPKVLYPDRSLQYLYRLLPTPLDLFIRRFVPIQSLRDKWNARYELHEMNMDKMYEIPYLSGCFMFIRSSVLEQVGGFDERFFLYMEDVDLSRRLYEVAQNVYYPLTYIIHRHEKASYKNLKCLSYHILSAVRYFNKWGWFFDRDRREINKKTLKSIQRANES